MGSWGLLLPTSFMVSSDSPFLPSSGPDSQYASNPPHLQRAEPLSFPSSHISQPITMRSRERIFKSIKPTFLEHRREIMTYSIPLEYSAIEFLISCLTSLEGISLALLPECPSLFPSLMKASFFPSLLVMMGLRLMSCLPVSSITSAPSPRASPWTEGRPETCWVVY